MKFTQHKSRVIGSILVREWVTDSLPCDVYTTFERADGADSGIPETFIPLSELTELSNAIFALKEKYSDSTFSDQSVPVNEI